MASGSAQRKPSTVQQPANTREVIQVEQRGPPAQSYSLELTTPVCHVRRLDSDPVSI